MSWAKVGVVALAVAGAGCSDASGTVNRPLPAFVFTSDADGLPGIYRWQDDSVSRLSADGHEDTQPHSAAGSIVFRSRRDGNGEIYIADTALGGHLRLTDDPWDDADPALSPDGGDILFVSNRSGSPRIWAMDADGENERTVATGSSGFVPEGAPAWSPLGDRIAFTSTRTGTSQVFVMGLASGEAIQVTHEATGAFQPAWTADGQSVAYTTFEGQATVRVVPSSGGAWRALAAGDAPLNEAACHDGWCLAVTRPPGAAEGDIVSVSRVGRTPRPVLAGDADEREPAFIVR